MITFKTFLILEAREDFVAQQLGPKLAARYAQDTGKSPSTPPIDIVNQLARAGSKYIQWIAKQYVAGQFKMEDVSRLQQDLSEFDRVKNRLQVKDINQYKNLPQLYAALKPFEEVDVVSKNQAAKAVKEDGADKIFEDGDAVVYRLKTQEAACILGRGTKWCTASTKGDNYFDHYNKQGPMFVVITKPDGEKYQIHFESEQFMDSEDQRIDLKEFAYQYSDAMSAIVLNYPDSAHYDDNAEALMPYISEKAQLAILKANYYMLRLVPMEERTEEKCMAAFSDDARAYRFFPPKFQTLGLSYKVIEKIDKTGGIWGEYIPKEHIAPIKEYRQAIRDLRTWKQMYSDDVDTLKILTNPKTSQESRTEEARRYLQDLIVSYNEKLEEYKKRISDTNQKIQAFEQQIK